MKVTIKLNAEQAVRAPELVERCVVAADEAAQMNCCYNTNADLKVSGRLLTYEGERCPMQQDGYLACIGEILSCGGVINYPSTYDAVEVISYVTSDKRLRWHETLHDYMGSRACAEDVVNYLISQRRNVPLWIVSHYPVLVPVMKLVGMSERLRYAQAEPSMIRLARRVEQRLI